MPHFIALCLSLSLSMLRATKTLFMLRTRGFWCVRRRSVMQAMNASARLRIIWHWTGGRVDLMRARLNA